MGRHLEAGDLRQPWRRQRALERAREVLGAALLAQRPLTQALLALNLADRRQPQFQLVHDDRRQLVQGLHLLIGRRARLGVDDVDGAEAMSVGGDDRCRRVEPHAELALDQRIGRRARIGRAVGDEVGLRAQDRRSAEPRRARDLRGAQTNRRLEPDALLVDDRDGRERHVEEPCGERADAIEGAVGGRVEDRVAANRREPPGLIGRDLHCRIRSHEGQVPRLRPGAALDPRALHRAARGPRTSVGRPVSIRGCASRWCPRTRGRIQGG